MKKVYLQDVKESLNLKKPKDNWLTEGHLEDNKNVFYMLFEIFLYPDKNEKTYIVCCSNEPETENEVVFYFHSSRIIIGKANLIHQFQPKDIDDKLIDKVNKLIGIKKASFKFYIYK